MTQSLGQLIREKREALGWSRATLSVHLGLVGSPPRAFGDTKIRDLEHDRRRYLDPDLVRRLIEVLELNAGEAWRAAYPEVAEAVLTAVGGTRPARAAGAGAQPASDLGKRGSACIPVFADQALTARKAA